MIRLVLAAAMLVVGGAAQARPSDGLDDALRQLAREGRFSGAVVIHGTRGVRFARGYGLADPFAGRRFTPDTPVDSGSLAKPVTAAAVLMLASEGRLDPDAPVHRYLPEYPHRATTVRHLLAHSGGLAFDDSPEGLAGKTNPALLAGARGSPPQFAPGSAFAYCNLCYVTLAMLAERVTGNRYVEFAHRRLALPQGVALRPPRLADWKGRAIGYRRRSDGRIERFDSWEGEAFHGPANLSLSARQLAAWGAQWWRRPLASIRHEATAPATIQGKRSGLSWGNWYCAADRRRCHYLGHHEGFHHLLYWDVERRISVAMMSNNALAPAFQQRLQRALVAFAEGRAAAARRELAAPLPERGLKPGRYRVPGGGTVVAEGSGGKVTVEREGIAYPAYLVGPQIRYVPGLDVYLAGAADGGIHWLSLHQDLRGSAVRRR